MKYWILVTVMAFLSLSCGDDKAIPLDLGPSVTAESLIYSISENGDDTYEVSEEQKGIARFSQTGNIVTLEIELSGFEPGGSHAIHIHNGSVQDPGRHWNQRSLFAACNKRSLGEVWAKPFAGDVGNITIGNDGNGFFSIQTDLWALNSGDDLDIIDKVIIVHQKPEDFAEECDPNHSHDHLHSNQKIAGGTIDLVSEIDRVESLAPMNKFADFTICN